MYCIKPSKELLELSFYFFPQKLSINRMNSVLRVFYRVFWFFFLGGEGRFFLVMAVPHSMQDLSSQSRDQIHAPAVEAMF